MSSSEGFRVRLAERRGVPSGGSRTFPMEQRAPADPKSEEHDKAKLQNEKNKLIRPQLLATDIHPKRPRRCKAATRTQKRQTDIDIYNSHEWSQEQHGEWIWMVASYGLG